MLKSFAIILLFSCGLFAYYPSSYVDQIVKHKFYSLGYDNNIEGARWTYHYLTKKSINGRNKRQNDFRQDPLVDKGSAKKYDYKYSGYDRGHLVPAADMKLSKLSMSESFFMSNMSPQHPDLNRRMWRSLESYIRKLVLKKGNMHVYTGPIFLSDDYKYLPGKNIAIPDAYYKLLYFAQKGVKKSIAFVMPNKLTKASFKDYTMSIDELEQLTGIDFLEHLDYKTQHKLESKISFKFFAL